ncbi:fimbrial protein [Pseudomonas caricapapayae]|jgi:hypothetical protein|uniref:Fimbrial protein n=1 Tax=Pseudomonas caricapapayae TaxID=46678 RepID=A0ACC7M154_9PSED
MSTLKNHLMCLLFVLAATPSTSYALLCKHGDTNAVKIMAPLGSTIAIPADTPDGTIIWESDEYTYGVRCEDDQKVGRELIYIYLKPTTQNLGTGIRTGIRYKSIPYNDTTRRIETGYDSYHGCKTNCVGWNRAYFDLTFSVFIEKYGPIPTSGQATTLREYPIFQLDGVGGMTSARDQNLQYYVTGVNGIRFVPCTPELTINPNVVEFRRVLSGTAKVGEVASSANFSLDLRRTCDTPVTVNARFAAAPGGGEVINNLLVPSNNSSVGISLVRQETNATVAFDKLFKLADVSTPEQIKNNFRADLIWRSTPIPGPFDAAAIVDLFYQ